MALLAGGGGWSDAKKAYNSTTRARNNCEAHKDNEAQEIVVRLILNASRYG